MHSPSLFLKSVNAKTVASNAQDLLYIRTLQIDQEKWDIGENDLSTFIQSKYFYFYLIRKRNDLGYMQTIGAISVFSDGHFAMIGSFIIDLAHRGSGLGQAVFSSILKHHHTTSFALLSAPGREPFYERNGFCIVGCFSKLRLKKINKTHLDMKVDAPTQNEIQKLLSFDQKYTGMNRKKLLGNLILTPGNITCTQFNEAHLLTGYGLLRPIQKGYRASVYALSSTDFEQIFGKLVNHLLSISSLEVPVSIAIDCPIEKEGKFLLSGSFAPEERYALMFKSISETPPAGLSGETTWGILTEECG